MKAVSAPSFISPACTRWPPSQTTATEERFTTIMIRGSMAATSKLD